MPRAPTPGSEPTQAVTGAQPTVAASSHAEATQAVFTGAGASARSQPRVAEEPLTPGARLGRYVIVGPLGAGGMGTVYAAHDPDLDRKVAIKVLHAGLAAQDGTSGPQRLLREAQAMARLSHPNVLAVHDVGVVGNRLFIAMELIDGCDLRQWLGQQRRSWRAILAVFMAAGAGLAAAHDAGIIHRDFKPDNVLIARNGRVLVGDFGLAAAASAASAASEAASRELLSRSWLGEAGSLTLPGALMGTPAYMAPEQMAGAEITPAVDIFSFCVALHEAIHGKRPFHGDSIANLFLAIQDERHQPPGASKVPRRLTRALRRGLAADPQARQPSMHALLAELRPLIGARRWWLVGAAALLIAGSAGAALYVAGAGEARCSGGEAAVAGVWSEARRADLTRAFAATGVAHAADTVNLVATDIDALTRAWTQARRDACEATHLQGEQSAGVLDRRMVCLDRQLGELDRLLNFLAEADAKVVDNAVALVLDLPPPTKCDAHALLSAAAGPAIADSPELLAIDQAITHARRLHRVGKYAPAITEIEPLIARLRELDEPRLLARALATRAQAGYIDSHPDVQAWTTEALAATMRVGDDARFVEIAANQLGLVGADEAARELWKRLAEAALEHMGGDVGLHAKVLNNYGNALRSAGKLPEAEAAQRAALDLRRRETDASPTLVADALFNLSAVLAAEERRAEALPLAREAIEIWTRELGPSHPRMVTALSNMAVMAKVEADYTTAFDLATRAHELARKLRGPEHPEVAHQLTLIASVEGWRGDLNASLRHFDEALAVFAANSGGRNDRHIGALLTAASFRVDAGQFAGAEALLDQARTLGSKLPPDHPLWLGEATTRVQIALGRGDLAAAERELVRARGIAEAIKVGESLGHLSLGVGQAELDMRRGRFAEAQAQLEPLRARFADEFRHPFTRGNVGFIEARVAWGLGRHAEARAAAEAARVAFAGLGPGYSVRAVEITTWLAGHADAGQAR